MLFLLDCKVNHSRFKMTFQPGVASVPSTSVELSLSCDNLRDLDVMSKSDPFCVVYYKDNSKQREFIEIGRTEMIEDNLNPVWQKKIVLDYNFEQRQLLKFAVYDYDGSSNTLDSHDFLGSAEASLGEIVSAQSHGFSRSLAGGARGVVKVINMECQNNWLMNCSVFCLIR